MLGFMDLRWPGFVGVQRGSCFQSQTLFWPYLRNGWSDWCEKEVHRFDAGSNMWLWPLTSPMTMTWKFSRLNFEIALSQELVTVVWSCYMWNKKEANTRPTMWPFPLKTLMTKFKVKVWNNIISGMWGPIDHDCDFWVTMVDGWMYQIHVVTEWLQMFVCHHHI